MTTQWAQLLRAAPRGRGWGSARLVALEGDNQGRRLWRMLASRGIVEARNAQTRPFSIFSAFLCDCRPPRCRPRWIPIQTPIVVSIVLKPLRFAPLLQSLPPLASTTPSLNEAHVVSNS